MVQLISPTYHTEIQLSPYDREEKCLHLTKSKIDYRFAKPLEVAGLRY